MAVCQLTSTFKPSPRQVSRLNLAGFGREFPLMVVKELHEPAKGLDFIRARSWRKEAAAESCF